MCMLNCLCSLTLLSFLNLSVTDDGLCRAVASNFSPGGGGGGGGGSTKHFAGSRPLL